MALGTESVSVELNTRAAGQALAKFVADLKAATKAGGGSLAQGMMIFNAFLQDVMPVITKLDAVKAEFAESPTAEVTTAYLTGLDIYKALVS